MIDRNVCPWCKSRTYIVADCLVSSDPYFDTYARACHDLRCIRCGSKWTDLYTFAGRLDALGKPLPPDSEPTQ